MPMDETAENPEVLVYFDERNGRCRIECDPASFRLFYKFVETDLEGLSPEDRAKVTSIEIADPETWRRLLAQEAAKQRTQGWVMMAGAAIVAVLALIGLGEVWSWIVEPLKARFG